MTDFDSKSNSSKIGTLSVVEEKLHVDKLKTVTGHIEVNKEAADIPTSFNVDLSHTTYEESRIPVNEVVAEMPRVRTEGDTIIIPVVREKAIIVKQLVLVEEIHFTKKETVTTETKTINLRHDKVSIKREDQE